MRPPRLKLTPLFDQFIEEIGKKKKKVRVCVVPIFENCFLRTIFKNIENIFLMFSKN